MRRVRAVLAFIAASLAVAACSAESSPWRWIQERLPGFESGIGQPAPDFRFQSFAGEDVALTTLAGKTVVLNFWASWCIPCRAEMPYFERVYRQYRDQGVVFVGLAVQDDPRLAEDFTRSLGISYLTGLDRRSDAATRYEVVGLPTTVFIAPDATVVKRWNGPVSEEQLTALVEQITRR